MKQFVYKRSLTFADTKENILLSFDEINKDEGALLANFTTHCLRLYEEGFARISTHGDLVIDLDSDDDSEVLSDDSQVLEDLPTASDMF